MCTGVHFGNNESIQSGQSMAVHASMHYPLIDKFKQSEWKVESSRSARRCNAGMYGPQ